jgi:hypothetical protein
VLVTDSTVKLTWLSCTGPTIVDSLAGWKANRIVLRLGCDDEACADGGDPGAEARLRRRSEDLARLRTNAPALLNALRFARLSAEITLGRSKKASRTLKVTFMA